MSLIKAKHLTLSFPFQINSKTILLVSFTNSLFSGIQPAWYRKMGTIKVLTILILLIMVRSLHLQIHSFCWIEPINSSALKLLLTYMSSGCAPWNCNKSVCQGNIRHIFFRGKLKNCNLERFKVHALKTSVSFWVTFFRKKILLSQCVWFWVGQWMSGSEWVKWEIHVMSPIRFGLL